MLSDVLIKGILFMLDFLNCNMFKVKKSNKCAFTLAEVLITLTIIGVVAATLIPSIITNSENRELITLAKKNYSILNQALLRYKADGGSMSDMFPPDKDSNYSLDQIAPYLNVQKKCTTTQICWNEKSVYLNKINNGYGTYVSGDSYYGKNRANAILGDGARISITNNGANITKSVQCDNKRDSDGNYLLDANGKTTPVYCTFTNYAFIYIDTNGAKGPNKFGYDNFEFRIYENKINGCGWSGYTGCIESLIKTDDLVKTTVNK